MGMLVYVGGASAAGKSTALRSIARSSGIALLELDKEYKAIKETICDRDLAKEVMYNVAKSLIEDILSNDIDLIVEGGWLRPCVAKEIKDTYKDQFAVAYCGYPNTTAIERLSILRNTGEGYICDKPESEALSFLECQVSGSHWYRDECNRYKFSFIDFSDQQLGSRNLNIFVENAFRPRFDRNLICL